MARVNSSALLIGCDFYFPGTSRNTESNQITFPHLLGAVSDVNRVEDFLLSLDVQRANIIKLTASYDPLSPEAPVEKDPAKWPTHANIIRELDSIEKRMEPGGLVYIHFSGHGIQRGEVELEKTANGGDSLRGAALATTDVLLDGGTYLTGYQLGLHIKTMTTVLGLRVTLVLDCCFSGRGLRDVVISGTYTPRTIIDCRDTSVLDIDRKADCAAEEHAADLSGLRHSTVRENWLSHPVGCTVITACGIGQTAGESTFSDATTGPGKKYGVLTYWMLKNLTQVRTKSLPSYATLKDYIIGMIKNSKSRAEQVPVLYGDIDFEFFGNKKHVRRPACRVIEVREDKVRLNVGSAQGVAKNAVYDVYPPGVNVDDIYSSHHAWEARVVKVDDFCSEALLSEANKAEEGRLVPSDHHIYAGGLAVLRSWALKIPRKVRTTIEDHNMRKLLKVALENTYNLSLLDDGAGAEQFVIETGNNIFEIHERTGRTWSRLQRLPAVAVDSELAPQQLAHLIRHVCRYREIENLIDHMRSRRVREEKFDMLFYRSNELIEPTETDGVKTFKVTAGEPLQLRLLYNGPISFVWVVLFELNKAWGVSKKLALKLSKGAMEPDKDSWPIGFSTAIPPKCTDSDSDDTMDIFMAFIVEGEDEVSWDELALEDLPTDIRELRLDFDTDQESESERSSRVQKSTSGRHWGVTSFVVHSIPNKLV
ncbi:hypothetical protein TWF730_009401 [Orbilia blumenaviensis]|uniref:Peptidase C14 caspase domain-containing protein n=1 Tax=Orbilia blumenaviensis TaxID=1796055 RepID=A0AAV9V0X2_9PEZI